ncbi:RNA recognition motif 2-domain-containing protein [Jimgerdemannia flammicorona]|uniref:RNA recognition motif 2-domain-containing protein n=1 Tax=Jimgerdemannia flammicorona TaxID=994334 RepID=A0A433Q8G2_9FUNG|nr:RNA recognition motif 2-domain-containing protein [Jimgerdemannia flammicorona]
MAEYYDERHAVAVKDDLHDKTIEGTRFQIIAYDADVLSWRAISTAFKNAGSTTPVRTSPQPQPQPDGYFGSHWARNTNGGSPPTRHNFSPGPRSCGVRIPDLVHDYFSTQPATTDSNMATHSPPIHNSTSPSLGFGFAFDADPTPYPLPSLRPRAVHAHTSSGPLDVHTETELMRRMQDTCIRPTPLVPWTDGYFDDVPVPGGVTVSGPAQILATSLLGRAGVMRKPREIVSTGVSSVVVGPTMATLMVAGGSNSSLNLNPMSSLVGVIASRNELDLDRILMGERCWRLDIRTTFMIRNIPNKYTQQMLIDSINETHKGAYDFLYLRIDFKNKCNVGYAFINFIDVRNRFNSDKRCTLSYANIQGKLALIEKFRNSNVMDEELSYRPKIFYTNGPLAGEEEPFPAPTISKETRLRLRQLRQRRYHTNPQCKPSSFLDYYRDDEAEGDIPEEGATADSMDDMIADGDVIGTEELGEPH